MAPQNLFDIFCAIKGEESQRGVFPIQKMRNVLARSFLTSGSREKNHAVNKLQLNFQSSRDGEVGRNGRLYQHGSNRRWTKFFSFLDTSSISQILSRQLSKSHFRRTCEPAFISFLPAISRRWPRFFFSTVPWNASVLHFTVSRACRSNLGLFERAHSLRRNFAVYFWSNESFEDGGKLLDNFFTGLNVCDTRVGS